MCEYNLLDQQLYSIKWYKDNQEVFRFVPRNSEPRQIFPMDGVSVDKDSSDQHFLSLTNLTHSSSGLYTCEVREEIIKQNFILIISKVSTEGPRFLTIAQDSIMSVIYHSQCSEDDSNDVSSGSSYHPSYILQYILIYIILIS